MTTAPESFHIDAIGSREAASKVLGDVYQSSSAYRDFLHRKECQTRDGELGSLDWKAIPLTTKKNFFSHYPWQEVVPKQSYADIYAIIRSSGTTSTNGSGFFWPQLRSVDVGRAPLACAQVAEMFDLARRKTLLITGFSLGSWAGGEQFAFFFKSLALSGRFPLVVFTPGNQHQEIVEIITRCGEQFDQILVGVCPSAIFYLKEFASASGVQLPLHKMSFLVTGEPFVEELRSELAAEGSALPLISLYGSADTGIIGLESPPLIAIRQRLTAQPQLARKLGLNPLALPNFYHVDPRPQYIERVDESLVITKWQGIPLVRYDLQDHVDLYDWSKLCLALAAHDADERPRWLGFAQMALDPVVAVYGRGASCVFLCGTNITESMLENALRRTVVGAIGTGHFTAWTSYDGGRPVLEWQIELKPDASHASLDEDALHSELVTMLCSEQPEFAEDYAKLYQPLEAKGLKIFRFHVCSYPSLAEHPVYREPVKRQVIIKNGPLC